MKRALLVHNRSQLNIRAFSSEVDTGSREENASKQEIKPRSDSIGTEKALVTVAGANGGFGDTHMFQQTAKTDPSKVTHLNRK